MMESRIALALTKLFDQHRIVFWNDSKQELRADFEQLDLGPIEKLEIENNEYAVKYHVLRKEPERKFLIYRFGPAPEDIENWLLDVQLAHAEFRTDQVALWLSELERGYEYSDVVQSHMEFYKAAKRLELLKRLLKPDDSISQIKRKMLAVCAASEPHIEAIVEELLQELAEDRDEKVRLIARCGLDGFLWEQLAKHYGYRSKVPSIKDFVIELFKSCYAMGTDGTVNLTGDALVFLKRWKDSRQYETGFEALSAECAEILAIESDLEKRDFRTLFELDFFRLIDQKIISDLVRSVAARTSSSGDIALWVRQRRQGHWYREFRHLYEAIDFAAQFIQTLAEANLEMDSFVEGIQRYGHSWFHLDQIYRKFTYHVRMSGQASLMGPLADQIENLYSNNYLLKLNDKWQTFVDSIQDWNAAPIPLQRNFYQLYVAPFLRKENKVCVIISDAMRYEIADELLGLIRKEDRYSAELEPALSMLPSYTQLGMAALLPNSELSINETGNVFIGKQNSAGTDNRIKVLAKEVAGRSTALVAEDLLALRFDECRTLFRDHDVIYVYHNRIDSTGDKRDTEDRVFEAAEDTLHELLRLIKKLTGANANNILITSDHGFIYQNRALEESDFSDVEPLGESVYVRNRRFVLGRHLVENPSLKKFSSSQLGLTGDMEIQIPKSINRLRVKGSGSRFVHGGATLQELVIPILKINKKRQSDVTSVEVEILRTSSSVITSGQLAVALYQAQPVTDKVQPRILRAGIYMLNGELISENHDLIFDLTSDNPRERELQVRFVLTRKADDANGQEVVLKLEEKHPGTSHFKEYKTLRYQMRRSFTSDFDF